MDTKKDTKYPKDFDKPIKDVKRSKEELPDIDRPSAEELRESGTDYPTATGQSA